MLSKDSQMEVELLVFNTRQSPSELVSFTYLPISHQISNLSAQLVGILTLREKDWNMKWDEQNQGRDRPREMECDMSMLATEDG